MNSISIGLGNFVNSDHVLAIVSPESAPVKRIVQDARDQNKIIDATFGRRTRAVIIMDNGAVTLSAIQPETIINRSNKD
jgi:regulator of extracellular matrix RemA (YlzA/DUF370 family)